MSEKVWTKAKYDSYRYKGTKYTTYRADVSGSNKWCVLSDDDSSLQDALRAVGEARGWFPTREYAGYVIDAIIAHEAAQNEVAA